MGADTEAEALGQLRELARAQPAVTVMWLYGSRARGDATPNSDYDLAVALSTDVATALDARAQLLDDLAYGAGTAIRLPVSCVDINRIPVPLAANIIEQGRVLFCRSDLRLRAEQQRVWSLWEAYKYEHERNREAL